MDSAVRGARYWSYIQNRERKDKSENVLRYIVSENFDVRACAVFCFYSLNDAQYVQVIGD